MLNFSSPTAAAAAAAAVLPVRSIPGSYGPPILGPLKDRLDYFWFQGPNTFFRERREKLGSTVFRASVPPYFPGINPKVIAVLDCKSFAHLFDMSLVQKRDVLVGDYMPSTAFTGDLRVLAYLDTEEPKHAAIKSFVLDSLKRGATGWAALFLTQVDAMFDEIEAEVAQKGSAGFVVPLQKGLLRFLMKALVGADTAARPDVDSQGYLILDTWLALQLIPTQKVGVIPQPLEELLLHSFPLPAFISRPGYKKMYDFIEAEGKETVSRGMRDYNLTKEETIHNLLFMLAFNAYGGFSIFFPVLLSTLGRDKTGLQKRLREEVRCKGGAALDLQTAGEMELVASTVYEVLRLNPPVELQFARARKDFTLSSHDSAFEVKKGELLCGYQKLVMRDPVVFDQPEELVPERFAGEKGKKLLEYLFWSNGPQTGTPSPANKQCAAKDYVVATAFLLVAAIFKRYDEFTIDEKSSFTRLVKAGRNDGRK